MERCNVKVTGIVQGVGFRPFVYNLARRHGLAGWVLNDTVGVEIEVEGDSASLDAFLTALRTEAPPLARLATVTVERRPATGAREFVIRHSEGAPGRTALVSPDVATCADCQREMLDPADRRYRYAFINCTNCGPRYTIIKDVPYDRATTTMASFVMCPACQAEYDDPANRRFHAQPNACPVCGPVYRLVDRAGREVAGDVFDAVRALVADGHIVAVKGIGGYHLACDAKNVAAVKALRERKIREDKPFAVMCGSLAAVRRRCQLSPAEEELLTGIVRPIVLLAKSEGYDLADSVAPGNPYLGVMLPYAPVHWLLLGEDDVWVMTSGNTSDEPIAYDDADARERLAGIADYFLVHNRPIYRRADDSVARVVRGQPYLLRRSRGYVPSPLALARPQAPVLACGGELKNTFCLTRDNLAFMSAHIGDLENMATFTAYTDAIAHYQRLCNVQPAVVAYDLHPEYLSTKYALSRPEPKIGIQHHHAHIAAVLAEHGRDDKVIGVAFDGTGYGTDGHLWGGEFLLADCRDFVRAAHCRYLPLPGGAKAIKEPWRLAAWVLYKLYGRAAAGLDIPFARTLPPEWELVVQAADKGLNAPLSSGVGRLFDAAAALLGIRNRINYEGQAAVELELAAVGGAAAPLPYDIKEETPAVLDFYPAFAALTERLARGASVADLAAAFHATVAAATADMVGRISRATGIRTVALSGGVFQNITLLEQIVGMLQQQGLTVLLHRQAPPNDGGLALGQAVIAGERSR
ncbi:(NiFe) hydrogenase maturation protein HypF [Thermosinus carboxydivorans Nor1]|uniref:Carbamoyltransferase n=1 Tax=Thermosinus carboxydivorans Nor1 TaxID=401526 RepID=A1HTY1_9FIRM|nr:carbamoyltransferase HypF [Thermosinus carboxydivorans]EAX46503.1 (NiFe) hydrogenase maturation protein HypF [Thermosinus carboxydivorans Nor1]